MSDPFRKAQPLEQVSNQYEILGLRDNPFPREPSLQPGSSDPRANGEIYSEELHGDEQATLEKLLIPSPSQSNPLSIAFLMDHTTRRGRGIGKSAFLKHQRDRIMSDFGEESSHGRAVMCAVHVIPPPPLPGCRKFWEFCRTIVEALIEQDIIASAIWRLRAFSNVIPDSVLGEVGRITDLAESIGNNKWLEKREIDVQFSLNRTVGDILRSVGVRDELAKILAYTPNSIDLRSRVSSSFSDYFWRKDGGRFVFDDLVKLFMAAQFTRCLLFIDEVEKMAYHQNMTERRAFVESLRYYLFDADFANSRNHFYGILLTIHPGVQELLSPHWKVAGLDGISPITQPEAQETTVYFGPLDRKMAIPLVKVYLDYYRISKDSRAGIEPFTEDAVIEALVKAGGVPRPMLRLLYRVVERAAELKVTKIDKKLIEEVYSTPERLEAEAIEEEETLPAPKVDLEGE